MMEVRNFSADTFWKGETRVTGIVRDGFKLYETRIFVKGSQLYDCSCSCMGENTVPGGCVHGRALLEAFLTRERASRSLPVSTSACVRTMIREYTNRDVARIVREEEKGEIHLFPAIIVSQREFFLECRIAGKDPSASAGTQSGRVSWGKSYIIRDLAAFADAVRCGQRAEYGKGLAFEHSLSAFDEESRPLTEFILEETESYSRYPERSGVRRASLAADRRMLPLLGSAADRFFSIMQGKTISCEGGKGWDPEISVIKENPPFHILAESLGEGGIQVSVPGKVWVFRGEKGFYAADGKHIYICDGDYGENAGIFLEKLTEEEIRPSAGSGKRKSAVISARDVPLFYSRVLSRIENMGCLDSGDIDWDKYRPDQLRACFRFDSDGPSEIRLEPVLSYGTFSFHPLRDEKVPREICRDVPGEFRISRLITRYFSYREEGTDALVIRDSEDEIYRLLSVGLDEFRALGEVWLSQRVRSFRVIPAPPVSIGIALNGGWLDLRVDAGDIDGREMEQILSQYRRKKKYYRMKNGGFLSLSDEGFQTLSRLYEGLAPDGKLPESGEMRIPAFRAFYIDSLAREDGHIRFCRDEKFGSMIRDLDACGQVSFQVPEELENRLHEYQKAGFSWLRTLDYYGFGGILADDMGLGKTVQILALLLSVHRPAGEKNGNFQSLIVCPASLIYNWEHECRTFTPSLKVLTAAGPARERREMLSHADQYDVIVTSYELLRRDLTDYGNMKFRFLILDEAQFIKNASTQSARAVKKITAQSRFALTGTPVENRLSELWSIFDYLMPGFLYSYRKFRALCEIPIVRDGDREKAEQLRRMIRPFVLRRLKADVLKELPDKLEKTVYSAFGDGQRLLYQAEKALLKKQICQGDEKLKILAQITRLRQICCDPSLCYEDYKGGSAKMETCISILCAAAEAGHKILVFSQFASMLKILALRLEREGIGYHLLTGSTPKEERISLVTSFAKDSVPVFLISLKAGGTGLNLTAADVVIHYDPWWNAAAQNQATDRAYRIGQKRSVTVYRLIVKNTIEENIQKLQEAKQFIADQIVTEGMVSLGELTREELLQLCEE